MTHSAHVAVRLTAGHKVAGTRLYRLYVDDVYRYLLVALRSREDAEDATQQVFLKLFQAMPAYRPVEPFRAWLFTLVRNSAIDSLRRDRNSRSKDTHLQAAHDELSRTEAPASRDAADASSLREMIHALPQLQRQTLELLYLEDLSAGEAARRLRRSPAAIRQVHRRALRALAVQLGAA